MDCELLAGAPRVAPAPHGVVVRLRAFTAADAPLVQEASMDRSVARMTPVPANGSVEAALAFIERQRARSGSRDGYSFAIADLDDSAVGQIALRPRDDGTGTASVSYWIRRSSRLRGYGAAALAALVEWAARIPQLRTLELVVEPGNEGSWRIAESVGFEREPWMLHRADPDDDRQSLVVYALPLAG